MKKLAAYLRACASTPQGAAAALDKLHPLELPGSTADIAAAKAGADAGSAPAAPLFPPQGPPMKGKRTPGIATSLSARDHESASRKCSK